MRVAIVHQFYDANIPSGENNIVVDQYDFLKNHGFDVKLFEVSSFKTDTIAKFPRTLMNLAFGNGIDLTKEIRDFHPDVVHIHNAFPSVSMNGLARLEFPKVLTLHNYRMLCANGFLLRDGRSCTLCLQKSNLNAVRYACYRNSRAYSLAIVNYQNVIKQREILSKMDVITSVSRDISEKTNSIYHQLNEIRVLPNFIDLNPTRNKFHNNRFVYIGRLSTEKGFDWLIDDWPKDFKLDVIGSGKLHERFIGRSNNLVTYLGHVPRETLLKLLPNYAGLIFPSLWTEGSPLSVIESLSSGIPIVLHRDTEISSVIEEYKAGIVLNDKAELTGALKRILGDPQYRSNAILCYEEMYSGKAWLDNLISIYKEAKNRFASGLG